MPAPKGIPIPEVRAFRLDERILDSRTTKGWMSDDERISISIAANMQSMGKLSNNFQRGAITFLYANY